MYMKLKYFNCLVNWSPCGNMLAAASFDATITVWEKESEGYKLQLLVHLDDESDTRIVFTISYLTEVCMGRLVVSLCVCVFTNLK